MTLEEFLELPETEPYTELIDGELCQKPVGKKKHSRAATRLVILLARHPATRAGEPRAEQGFRFPRTSRGNLRVPDLCWYAPGVDDETDDSGYPARAPDLAVEVLSKGQGRAVLEERLAFLRLQGTRCTLLVDPEASTVTANEDGREWTVSGDGELVLASLGGFSFRPADLLE